MHCTPGERTRSTKDFAMNRFLLIAVYGSVVAISFALHMNDYGEEENTAVWVESLSDFDQNAEYGDLDKNRPEAYTDDEDEKRSSDPKWQIYWRRSNRRRTKQNSFGLRPLRVIGLRRRRRRG